MNDLGDLRRYALLAAQGTDLVEHGQGAHSIEQGRMQHRFYVDWLHDACVRVCGDQDRADQLARQLLAEVTR